MIHSFKGAPSLSLGIRGMDPENHESADRVIMVIWGAFVNDRKGVQGSPTVARNTSAGRAHRQYATPGEEPLPRMSSLVFVLIAEEPRLFSR